VVWPIGRNLTSHSALIGGFLRLLLAS